MKGFSHKLVSCNIISRINGCKDFGFQYDFNDVLFVQQLIISFVNLKANLKYLRSKNVPFFYEHVYCKLARL